jgi:hypothetical protein
VYQRTLSSNTDLVASESRVPDYSKNLKILLTSLPAHIGWVANGGYCCALIISTSKKYLEAKYPERKQPDPIHLHVQYVNSLGPSFHTSPFMLSQYLKIYEKSRKNTLHPTYSMEKMLTRRTSRYLSPLPAGSITLTITDLKLSSKHSVLQISLSSPKSASAAPAIIALVTHGNLSPSSQDNTNSINIDIDEENLPNRETECVRWTDAKFYTTNPTSVRYRSYSVKGGPNPLWSPVVGRNKRDMWVKVDEEGKSMGLAHLGVIADLVSGLFFCCVHLIPVYFCASLADGMER